MTDLLRRTLQRLVPAAMALSFLFAPFATRAETLGVGSGAPPRSLIGSPTLGPSIGKMSFAALLALDIPPSGLNVGPRITGEVMYGAIDLAPQLRLDLGGRLAFAYHGLDTGFANVDGSFWSLDLMPDAKLRYAINDQFGVYGDFGLGFVILRSSVGSPFSTSDTSLALGIQFGGGVAYALTPNINLLGEIRFDVTTKSGAGLFVALPTVGLEFH